VPASDPTVRRLLDSPRYEVVPIAGAVEAAAVLPPRTTVTVTFSSTRGVEPTVALVEALARQGLRPVPHLAARSLRDAAELTGIVRRLHAAGVTDVFVVGGDPVDPAGAVAPRLVGHEARAARDPPVSALGGPAYPEGHPAVDAATLDDDLRAKQAHATYCVTQLCFDAEAIVRWLAHARRAGVALPVRFGVPGVVDRRRLTRMSLRIGVGPSLRFLRRHRRAVARLVRPGGFRPDGLLRGLAEGLTDDAGVAGVHLYTFNHVAATWQWVQRTRAAVA
jgi:methylenetetrahydrofolate reductase (NADPH)